MSSVKFRVRTWQEPRGWMAECFIDDHEDDSLQVGPFLTRDEARVCATDMISAAEEVTGSPAEILRWKKPKGAGDSS